jgi:hypothetical protein
LRSGLIAVACAACRLNFDEVERDDAGPPDDERALATPCNTPVLLHPEPAPTQQLSAAATTSTLVASWLRSDGTVGEAGARLVPGGLEPFTRPALAGTWSGVALAASGGNVMSALGQGTTSKVRFLDEHLTVFEHALSIAVSLPGTRGASALRSGSYPFVLAGTRSFATGAQALAPSELGPELDALAEPQEAVETVAFDNDFAIVSARAGTCRLIRLRPDSGPIAPLATWGTSCATPTAAHLPGRTNFLLSREDTVEAAIDFTIGTLVGGGVSLPAERRLAPGSHPRAVATHAGYWIAAHTRGNVEARLLDFTGEQAGVVSLGSSADAPTHEVVAVDGTAYALWVQPGAGLKVARLCPNEGE